MAQFLLRNPFVSFAFVAMLALAAGCGDSSPTGSDGSDGDRLAVIVNSVEISLTVFPLDDPDNRRTIPLGPEGTPVGGAVRGPIAAIPLGVVPAVAVVDLVEGIVLRTVGLPEGSGATGAHFVNDSIVLVANPGLDHVSPVNVLRGTLGDPIPAGGYPQGFVEASGRVFVINAELVDFAPAGPGTLTALDPGSLEPVGEVVLSGTNPGDAVVGPDGNLMVLAAGSWGQGDASLSVVDPESLAEVASYSGFGDLPGSLALVSARRLLASSWSYGVAEWDPATTTFVRGPEDAYEPAGVPSSAGVAVDPDGGLWSLFPECQEAATVLRLSADMEVEQDVPVGVCPAAILFTEI